MLACKVEDVYLVPAEFANELHHNVKHLLKVRLCARE